MTGFERDLNTGAAVNHGDTGGTEPAFLQEATEITEGARGIFLFLVLNVFSEIIFLRVTMIWA